MSRLAKKPLKIPGEVKVESAENKIVVKGPKGELEVAVPAGIEVKVEGENINVKPLSHSKQNRANVGTIWALLRNALEGVTAGFSKVLEIEGVGYRAAVEGGDLVLSLGYVNPVRFRVPPGIKVSVEKNVITVSGVSKELVGLVAAQIRSFKKPEPYKGKGIRYRGEVIRRKVGKKAAAAGSGG
jgi:large subunit ribosomal protein L6